MSLAKSSTFGALLACALLGTSPEAMASPWTLPKDELVVGVNYDLHMAGEEYLPDGTRQSLPLNGSFVSNTLRLDGRYGFTDRFEGAVDVHLKQVNLQMEPLVLIVPGDAAENPTAVNRSIVDFSKSRLGVADVHLQGRYNLFRGPVLLTLESALKLPSGYERPRGTFAVDGDPTTPVQGSVTLGDAQTDFTQSLLLGFYVAPTRSFGRLDAGIRLRSGPPGPQVVSQFKLGQFLSDNVVLSGALRGAYTLQQGERIGVTMIAVDPEVPRDFFRLDNVRPTELYADKDYVMAEAGVLVRVDMFELQAGYGYTLWGRNVAALHALSVGVVMAIPAAASRE